MKNIKKFLIASIILIVVGAVGLVVVCATFSFTVSGANPYSCSGGFRSSTAYSNRPYGMMGMMGMMRGFNFSRQNTEDISKDINNLTFDEIKSAAEKYLVKIGLKNVKVKEIMEFSNNYYIETVEEDTGSGAVELLLDKTNGTIYPEYGPNMMWNQKYGMHFRFSLTQAENNMSIDEEKAIEIANSYLTETGSNEFAGDEAEKFYGYYTIDTVNKDGTPVGMLSVNGFTGQVWYHNWHGAFIEMKEY